MSESGFYRCTHCRGFYETEFDTCKWCAYDVPLLQSDGSPKVFPDRETCRAIQIEEYDKLPAEAYEDCMGPPADGLDLICICIHCGPNGHAFEAVEMRWMANESMWACPCTTCGGRGFTMDILPRDLGWECVDCGHRYAPEDGRYVSSNCKCPKCGCTMANGWFDTEEEDEEFEDEEFEEIFGPHPLPVEEQIPWEDEPWQNDVREWKPGDDAEDDDAEFGGEPKLPDDIDFPHDPKAKGTDISDDDIPF